MNAVYYEIKIVVGVEISIFLLLDQNLFFSKIVSRQSLNNKKYWNFYNAYFIYSIQKVVCFFLLSCYWCNKIKKKNSFQQKNSEISTSSNDINIVKSIQNMLSAFLFIDKSTFLGKSNFLILIQTIPIVIHVSCIQK